MTRILVTGAGGWLGVEIVRALAQRGDEVVAMDVAVSEALADITRDNDHVFPVSADLCDPTQLARLFDTYRPNAAVHCAAVVGVIAAERDTVRALEVNVGGTLNLFEAMHASGVKRVVHVSTEETYGHFTSPAIDEEHPQRPTSVYGVTKLAAEQFGRVYHARHGIECINVRTCWVYGPGLPRARVPKTFIDAAIAGEPFHLEDGDLTVDQVYVTDTVAGVLLALDKANHRYDSYNIATGYAPALREVAAIVRDLVPGARLSVGNGPYLHGAGVPAVKKGALNIDRARRELGYAPQYDIRRGLQEMIAAALHTPINKDSN